MRYGVFAVCAYGLWGLFPVFWKLFHFAPADFVLAHRVLWSCLLLAAVLILTGRWSDFRAAIGAGGPRLAALCGSATVIASNWVFYIYAVNTDRVVEAGLGYFINPLINVLLGVLFLRERPAPLQIAAVALAAVGVGYYVYDFGRLPWISLVLGFSFGFYGLFRKLSPMPPLFALQFETGVLALPALLGLAAFSFATSSNDFFVWPAASALTPVQWLTLASTGIVTVLPLYLFLKAAAGLRLGTLGLFQYIAPTTHLLLGVWLYAEPFTRTHTITFGLIWSALLLYSASILRRDGSEREPAPAERTDLPNEK